MLEILKKVIENASKIAIKSILVFHESILSKDELKWLIDSGITVKVVPKNINLCNSYKKMFRLTRRFEIVFDGEAADMSDVDFLIVSSTYDFSKVSLKTLNSTKFIFCYVDEIRGFDKIGESLFQKSDDVMISSLKDKQKESSIIKILNIKPTKVEYGDGTTKANGRLAVGLREEDEDLLNNLKYLDVDVFKFTSDKSKATANVIYLEDATDEKIRKLLSVLSNAEFVEVLSRRKP